MSDPPNSDPRPPTSAAGSGVLAGLPRTRPQRASARRAASRATKSSTASTTPVAMQRTGARKPPPRQAQKRRPARSRGAGPVIDEPAPRQGYEAEPDSLGGPVQPPGGTELVASAAELAGELAKSGVTAGARVLRDFLSRLPG